MSVENALCAAALRNALDRGKIGSRAHKHDASVEALFPETGGRLAARLTGAGSDDCLVHDFGLPDQIRR